MKFECDPPQAYPNELLCQQNRNNNKKVINLSQPITVHQQPLKLYRSILEQKKPEEIFDFKGIL